jgi:hypothetical protein
MTDAGKDYFEHIAVTSAEADNGEFSYLIYSKRFLFYFWLNFWWCGDKSVLDILLKPSWSYFLIYIFDKKMRSIATRYDQASVPTGTVQSH